MGRRGEERSKKPLMEMEHMHVPNLHAIDHAQSPTPHNSPCRMMPPTHPSAIPTNTTEAPLAGRSPWDLPQKAVS
jgi:hypothetical protein